MIDKLDYLFNKQEKLQKELGVIYNQEYINTMVLAMIAELTEVLNETPWKPWKKNQVMNKEKYLDEMVDVFHFFINLCLVNGINSTDIFTKYLEKHKENLDRKDRGY